MVKVGGPVYRIGVGGGAASSIQVTDDRFCGDKLIIWHQPVRQSAMVFYT